MKLPNLRVKSRVNNLLNSKRNKALLLVLVFGVAGTITVIASRAATEPVARVEAESMTLSTGASLITDTYASGGQAIRFTQSGSTVTTTLNLDRATDSITIVAKANKCKGAWPTLTVSIDNSTVLTSQVKYTSWHSYNVTKNLSSGTHNLSVKYNSGRSGCNDYLYVDTTIFSTTVGDPTPPPPPSDTTAPTVSLTAPVNGATVSGSVSVTANASDNVGVSKVEFYVDGALKATDTTSSYTYSWDTTQVSNGSHSLQAKAYDAAGNIATSPTATVTVQNQTTPPPTATTSCMNQQGPLVTLTGSKTVTDYRSNPLAASTKVDARTATWYGSTAYPIFVEGGSSICWSGGKVEGTFPTSDSWDAMRSRKSFEVFSENFILENLRAHNYGDGITIKEGGTNWTMRGVYFTQMRDDCVENDQLYVGTVDDSLFDGCYGGFSSRPGSSDSTSDGRNNLFTIKNTLVRLQPMESVYTGSSPGHGGFFKWDNNSDRDNQLSLHNNIFRADQLSNHGNLGVPTDKLVSCSNNIVVWLGTGSYPVSLPSCFTVTTDKSVWDNAVARWKTAHGY
jgi:hypothetical protein